MATSRRSSPSQSATSRDHLGMQHMLQCERGVALCDVSFPHCSWVWVEGGQNPDLEDNLDIGGFGYPVGVVSCYCFPKNAMDPLT